ncbi:hypothetical protein BPC006_I3128 [Burkholderia pseudomallei BPC006]|nr:hypothetical protein BPC006_I3128 [Burkholderia pseudomallei BPC006]
MIGAMAGTIGMAEIDRAGRGTRGGVCGSRRAE